MVQIQPTQGPSTTHSSIPPTAVGGILVRLRIALATREFTPLPWRVIFRFFRHGSGNGLSLCQPWNNDSYSHWRKIRVTGFSADALVIGLAIIGIVIVVSALLSGLIERSGLPQVAVFLAIGAALGPAGLGVIDIRLESQTLRIVATLSLTLVLFTDAVALNISEVQRHATLAVRVLGPGTLLSAAIVGFAGWWLLGLTAPAAAILGAALASTDPVLLRGVLRRRDIPTTARQALQL